MAYCWLCETLLTEGNQSREHIIPAALGGKRTVANFLCRRCNNSTGSKWDAALVGASKPMDFIASFGKWQEAETPHDYDLGNRANRHETKSGNETRTMYRGGGDSVTWIDGQTRHVKMFSHSEVQMQRISEGIRRKYSISREKWADAEHREKGRSEDHSIQTGIMMDMPKVTRAMVKSMLALACAEDVRREECQRVLEHWRTDDVLHLGDFPEWEVLPVEEWSDLRSVAVSGSPETGVLLGFTNLAGSMTWMTPLAAPYEGPPRHAVYAFNARTGKDVTVSPQMERPRAEAIAMETAAHLAEMVFSIEDLPPEAQVDLMTRGQSPREAEIQSMQQNFAPGLRGFYNISREVFNQTCRLPLSMPPIGEDGQPC